MIFTTGCGLVPNIIHDRETGLLGNGGLFLGRDVGDEGRLWVCVMALSSMFLGATRTSLTLYKSGKKSLGVGTRNRS